MKAGIELQSRFHCKYSVHFSADELEEVFDAGVLEMPTVHNTPPTCCYFTTGLGYVSL